MLNTFSQNQTYINRYKEFSQLLDSVLGEALSDLISNGPDDALNLTANTQPAMLFAGYLIYQAWLQAGGVEPDYVAGHSLGEYTAIAAAGGLQFHDAIQLVRFRANSMQNAVPVGQGGMAAIIGLEAQTVVDLCKQVSAEGLLVQAVNFNAPTQIVFAGTQQGIKALCAVAKQAGAKRALELPVSAPFHSSLLKPAADQLKRYLDQVQLQNLRIPLITNVDVIQQTSSVALKDSLVRQAHNPVRWVETIQYLVDQEVQLFVECGPGKVLTGLVKRITEVPAVSISSPESIQEVLQLFE